MADTEARQDTQTADGAAATARRPPRAVFLTAIILVISLVVPWWLLLEPSGYGHMIFAVCAVFTLIAFGIAAISAVRAVRNRAGGQFVGATRKWLSTWTGRMPMRAAVVQILLIPGCLAFGFIALALVDVVVRS